MMSETTGAYVLFGLLIFFIVLVPVSIYFQYRNAKIKALQNGKE